MDKSLFSSKSLGTLQRIRIDDGHDWAFIPDPLPDKWDMPIQLWPLLSLAKEELARLDGVGRHMPGDSSNLLLTPLQKREALKSSSLEGAYATAEELLLFEKSPREPTSEHDKVNSWMEVRNYSRALQVGQDLLLRLPLSIRLIREMHKELLTGVRGANRNPGNFRINQVHIGSDRRFVPPPAGIAVECLQQLEIQMNSDVTIDPLLYSFMVHYQFETIHPFSDGNGRVGRLLLSLMIFKRCNLVLPWLYLSEYFDRYKDEYVNNLFNVSVNADWKSYLEFCLRATVQQAREAIVRFDSLVDIQRKYQKIIASSGGSARLSTIVESLFNVPFITIPDVRELLNTTYPTAKNDIERLISLQILKPLARSEQRPKIFYAKEIFDVAYHGT
ncbi:MAG: Fic/DOC family N-terminal domain-containing protein [Desulfoprunum sp.]|jgi:Fic family protein|uniref:Fic family protein n=1 Tax=Desulfoprunum sp. TaxID=2020866 RepID=UPI003C7456EA